MLNETTAVEIIWMTKTKLHKYLWFLVHRFVLDKAS